MNLIEQDKSFIPEGDWEYERVFDNTEPKFEFPVWIDGYEFYS